MMNEQSKKYEITICKSENGTWFLIAFCKKWNTFGAIYEGRTRKECAKYLEEHEHEIRCA